MSEAHSAAPDHVAPAATLVLAAVLAHYVDRPPEQAGSAPASTTSFASLSPGS